MSLTDDELGVTMTLRIEDDKIKRLHFDAVNGHGITAESLGLVEAFGLQLPASEQQPSLPEPPPTPAAPPPAPAAPRRRSVPPNTYAAKRPSDDEFIRRWPELGTKRYAAELGVPASTVNNWVSALRARGVTLELSPTYVPHRARVPTYTGRHPLRPDDAVLLSRLKVLGSHRAYADELGVPVSTFKNWVAAARKHVNRKGDQ